MKVCEHDPEDAYNVGDILAVDTYSGPIPDILKMYWCGNCEKYTLDPRYRGILITRNVEDAGSN